MIRFLVDMDGVMTNFNKAVWDGFEQTHPELKNNFLRPNPILDFYAEDAYESTLFKRLVREINTEPGFFRKLEPIEGAIEALQDLQNDPNFQVYICTAPLLENPTCTDDKMAWVLHYLGYEWTRRTIISKDKTVIDGDFLIDDKPLIEGVQDPIWQRIVFDQPYNKQTVGRRLNWKNYRSVIDSIW